MTNINQMTDQYYESRTDMQGCRATFWVMVIILIALIFNVFTCHKINGQSWSDTNRGLYPQSVSITYNAHNTALGVNYSYLLQNKPIGFYTSFSNTINPDLDYNNYNWERKYSLGCILTLPHNLEDEYIHTMVTLGLIYNEHPREWQNKDLPIGLYMGNVYSTTPIGCDLGIRIQIKHFTSSLKVDVVNFMRYVEFGCGYTFYRIRK